MCVCVCVCVLLCRKSMEDYNKSLDKLTIQILELCAEGLGLKSSTFTEPYLGTAGDCIARFNYYPPCPLPSLGAHTDPNLLTILYQCSVGGLQICHGQGSWFSVKPSPNAFIINVGDSFEVCMYVYVYVCIYVFALPCLLCFVSTPPPKLGITAL
jgi:gibberellin 20-oxidase